MAPDQNAVGDAVVLDTLHRYDCRAVDGASVTCAQKLAYLLQQAGEDLGLEFSREDYGPRANELERTLRRMDGHALTRSGDGSGQGPDADLLIVMPEAAAAACRLLTHHPASAARVERVLTLTEGYESTYSLELVASVHWIAHRRPEVADDPRAIGEHARAWTAGGSRLFRDHHVESAWTSLLDLGWLPAPART